jgi:replication initiation and membrane attachment protein
MKQVNPSDLYEVRPVSLLGGLDLDYLLDLYEPLIGGKALSAYLTLSHEKVGVHKKHEDIFLATSLSSGEWFACLEALEAVGLVRTFTQPGNNCLGFVYCLYAPKTPGEFFENALFAGTLVKTIGKDRAALIADKYKLASLPVGYDECTESFATFFPVDFGSKDYEESQTETGHRVSGNAPISFDRNVFIAKLKQVNNLFVPTSFREEEYKEIESLAALYRYDENTIADLALDYYDFFSKPGHRFNMEGFRNECQVDAKLGVLHEASVEGKKSVVDSKDAKAVFRLMDTQSPYEFLISLQDGNKPAPSDVSLAHELTFDMGLPNCVANTLMFYLSKTKDGVINRKYAEKIAATLVRKHIRTSIDAWNYLKNSTKNGGRYYSAASNENKVYDDKTTAVADVSQPEQPESVPMQAKNSETGKPLTKEEYAKMIEEFKKKLNNGN